MTQPHDMAEALVQGETRRAVGATAMNERSSRSHTVFGSSSSRGRASAPRTTGSWWGRFRWWIWRGPKV